MKLAMREDNEIPIIVSFIIYFLRSYLPYSEMHTSVFLSLITARLAYAHQAAWVKGMYCLVSVECRSTADALSESKVT